MKRRVDVSLTVTIPARSEEEKDLVILGLEMNCSRLNDARDAIQQLLHDLEDPPEESPEVTP